MPLDYSKWDNIELSDDEDIEVHPNVDKKSFIKWKQMQVQEERTQRRNRITQLKSEIEKLLKAESKDEKQIEKLKKELEDLEKHENRTLSVDKLKTGFDKTSVNKASSAVPSSESKPKSVTKTTEKVIEVLNPEAVAKGHETKGKGKEDESEAEEHEYSEYITTPRLIKFAHLKGFEDSFKFIQNYPYIVSQESSDEIMSAAFAAEMRGKSDEAKTFVHQALTLQYCVSLGKDGVGLFFKRITTPGHQSIAMFNSDLERTCSHIQTRSKALLANQSENKTSIFEGKSTDPKTMEAFRSLPKEFQDALLTEDIDEVNKVLGTMKEEEAKKVLTVCKESGLLDIDEDDVIVMEPEEVVGTLPEAENAAETNGGLATEKTD